MTFAPVLSEVAAKLTGTAPSLVGDPARWAYALRDAVDLVRPDWIVTHHDLALESDALTLASADADGAGDVDLGATPAGQAVGAAAATLAGIYPGKVVAASVTGPATVAAAACRTYAIDPDDDAAIDLLDACADVLATYAATLAEGGAGHVLVWETEPGGFDPADIASAHRPLVRRLATVGVPVALCHRGGVATAGYAAVAAPGSGLVDPAAFVGTSSYADVEAAAGPQQPLFITDGPIPATCDPAVLRSAGERTTR